MIENNAGLRTLKTIQSATRFNKWMYQNIKKFLSGSVLEIGSGIGNISRFVLEDNIPTTLSEIDDYKLSILKDKFSDYKNLNGIYSIDLEEKNFSLTYGSLNQAFDSVFFLNVLEHIENDNIAVLNCRYLLKEKGTLVVLVPAHQFLYSAFDKEIGHYRRYSAKHLYNLCNANGFEVKTCFHFNALGIPGWLINKWRKRKEIGDSDMRLFEKLVPIAQLLDKVLMKRVGLSIIIVAQKKD